MYKTKEPSLTLGFLFSSGKRDCQSPVPAARLAFDPSGLHSLRSCQAQNLPPRACAHESNYAAPLLGSSSNFVSKTKEPSLMLGFLFSSGKRDSDPRPRPWQGRALPTELFPRGEPIIVLFFRLVKGNVGELIKNILFFC